MLKAVSTSVKSAGQLFAEDYGVNAANSAATNATNMLVAIKAAISENKTLVLPVGDIKCNEILGTALTNDSTHFAIGNNVLHIDIPSGCRILRQNGVWWLNVDTSDEAVLYTPTAIELVSAAAKVTVSAITKSTTPQVTYTGSDSTLANDKKIAFESVGGMTELNTTGVSSDTANWYTVKNLNTGANTFDLYNAEGTAFVNTSSYGTYTSGGSIRIDNNLFQYTKSLAITVADASDIRKYDRITLVTVPSSGYLVTNDDGDDYGYPVEDLPVLDVNYTSNVVYVSLPIYKSVTATNTRFYHWPNRDALLKITGAGDFILDPATGDPEDITLTDAREFIKTIGCRIEAEGDRLAVYDSDRGFAHIQRTIGSIVRGFTTKRTRNQSAGASDERKLSYFVDNYANKYLLLEDIDAEGARHLDTGNTEKSTNRYNFGYVTKTNPVTFYYDASSSSMSSGEEIYVDGTSGMTEINQQYFTLANTASLLCSITTISNANPAVVTYTGSDSAMANDRKVYIYGVVGMTEVNGNWYTVKNWNSGAKTFELYSLDGTTPINSTGYGVHVNSTTDKITFGYAELSGVNGTGYGTWTSGGWAFEVSDWVHNGYSIGRMTRNIRGRQGQGNNGDSHAGEAGNQTDGVHFSDPVEYYDGLITPKGTNFRGNGDAASNVTLKNVVQACTFDGMQMDHAGFNKNLYAVTNVDIENPIWEADQDLFGFEGSATSTTTHRAVLSNVRIKNGAVGRIAKLEAYCGEVVFDNLQVLSDLARVATGTSSRYLFTVNGTGAKLVIKDTTLDFSNCSILDSTGAVSTAALKRFGTMVGNGEVVLDNVRILGTSKLDPRYGLFGTDASGTKTIKTRNLYLDNPNFPISGVPGSTLTISSATNANPIVCTTSTSHGYSSGDLVYIADMDQMTALNMKAYPITVLSTTTFSIPVDGTSMSAETGGGTCAKITKPTDVTISTLNEDGQGVFNFRDRNVMGYTGSNLIKRTATVSTTDATVTTLISIPLAEGEVLYIDTHVAAIRSTAAEAGGWHSVAIFRRAAGGNVTQVSTTAALLAKEDSSGTPSVAFNANTTSQTAELRVTGEAAKTFYWVGQYEYFKVISSS